MDTSRKEGRFYWGGGWERIFRSTGFHNETKQFVAESEIRYTVYSITSGFYISFARRFQQDTSPPHSYAAHLGFVVPCVFFWGGGGGGEVFVLFMFYYFCGREGEWV